MSRLNKKTFVLEYGVPKNLGGLLDPSKDPVFDEGDEFSIVPVDVVIQSVCMFVDMKFSYSCESVDSSKDIPVWLANSCNRFTAYLIIEPVPLG